MAEEKILYDFQGDASSLISAAHQAIDAMQSVDQAQNQLASSNPFNGIANTLNNLHNQLTTVRAAQQAFSGGLNSAREASESLKGSLGGAVNNLAIMAMRMKDAYNAGYAFSGSQNVIKSAASGASAALNVLGSSIQSQVQSKFGTSQQAIHDFTSRMKEVSSYATLFTQGMNPVARALSYASTMANEGREAFAQFLSPIIQARRSLGEAGDAADSTGQKISNANKEIKNIQKQTTSGTAGVKNLKSGFNALATAAKSVGNAIKGTFKGMSTTISSLVSNLGILGSSLSLGNVLGDAIAKSNAYIESLNLFKVSAGDMYAEMQANIDVLEHYGGLAPSTLMTAAGTFKLLATEMGVASNKAAIMSNSLTNVSVDLSSLFNKDFQTVMEDLESGMQGMTRAVRKYGIDISEASLAETAAAYGIQKYVENMSQAEKMQLRYATIIRQTSLAQTDFARTIQTPANMLKILKEQVLEVGRAIGNVFQPVLQIILPVLIKFTLAIKTVISALATLVGYKAPDMAAPDAGAYKDAAAGAGAIADNTAKAAKQQKKLNNLIGGFDEINALQDPSASSGSSGSKGAGGGGSDLGIELPTYDNLLSLSDFMPKLREEADQVANSFMTWLAPIQTAFATVKSAWAPVSTAFSNFTTTVLPAVASGLQTIIISGIFSFLSSLGTALNTILPPLTSLATSLLPVLATSFNTVAIVAGTLVGVFATVLAGVMPSMESLGTAFHEDLLQPLLIGILTIAKIAGPSLITLFSTLNSTVATVISTIGPPLTQLFTTLGTTLLPMVCTLLSDLISTILPPLATFLKGIIEALNPFITTVAPIINELLGVVVTILGNLLNALLPPLLEIIQTSIDAIKPLLKAVLPPLIDLISHLGDFLTEFIEAIMPPLIELFEALIVPLSDILSALLPPLIECVDRLLAAIMPLLANVLPPLIKIVTRLIKPIMQIIEECLVPLLNIIITILTPILEIVINTIEILLAVLLPIIDEIVSIIDFALQPFIVILKVLIDVLKLIVSVSVKVFSRIKDVIMGTLRSVITIFQNVIDVFNRFRDFIKNKLWGTVKAVFQKIGDFISDIFKGVINGIISVVNQVIKAINWLIKGILSPFNAVIKGLNKIPGANIPKISLEIPKIPKMAMGGVVTSATILEAGEGRYDEAIIPLGESPQMRDFISKIADAVSSRGGPENQPDPVIQVFIGNEMLDEYVYRVQRKRELQTNGG